MNGLSITQTEAAIKTIKDTFEVRLSASLNLRRISAPLFLDASSALNDHLSGNETPLTFTHGNHTVEVVQSLAKWKRHALYHYEFNPGEGLYTDMNAIRPSETLDALHSHYVDQWDWEKVITAPERTLDTLKASVEAIYKAITSVERTLVNLYPTLSVKLPDQITFIDAETLRQRYPSLSPTKREARITEEKTAVFITRIGHPLGDGQPHDQRSPDYDDWSKNGDLLVWHKGMGEAIELSSMGIRVDRPTMDKQLRHFDTWREGTYHKNIRNYTYPLTIGGGIGQSRLCLFILEKHHIGQVQATYWSPRIRKQCKDNGITLL